MSKHVLAFNPLRPRDPKEPHRAATPLELFFDLVFVVAIAQAAEGLHHAIASGHALDGIGRYALVFFAIWWAWMNFTWFASAYDNDDAPYRMLVFVQLTGALILAAGVGSAFERLDLRIAVVGYVVMRLAMVTQWLRAAHADPQRKRTALRYAGGVAVVQALWVVALLAAWPPVAWLFLIGLEVAVPVLAESAGPTPWHAGHIQERYGLLVIIVLGEVILAASLAIQAALAADGLSPDLVSIIVGVLLIVFSLWWAYFDFPLAHLLTSMRTGFLFGYVHYGLYAAGAALGAGIAVVVDQVTHHAEVSAGMAGAAVAVPAALFVILLWLMHLPNPDKRPGHWVAVIAAGLILLTPGTGHPVLWTGLVLAGLTTFYVRSAQAYRAAHVPAGHGPIPG